VQQNQILGHGGLLKAVTDSIPVRLHDERPRRE
jgi:hypothetical protein